MNIKHNNDQLKVGLVGCGEISNIHIPALKKIEDCGLFAG